MPQSKHNPDCTQLTPSLTCPCQHRPLSNIRPRIWVLGCIDLTESHPLTDFKRNTKADLKHLKKAGKPQVLTVNGPTDCGILSRARRTFEL